MAREPVTMAPQIPIVPLEGGHKTAALRYEAQFKKGCNNAFSGYSWRVNSYHDDFPATHADGRKETWLGQDKGWKEDVTVN
ncbi:hypothetical protein BRADI_2g12815v3 [Brachypodium distachyon]|uniref:Uncharacterized protein n=1 Tax=Brachypodium distachyon TaxID=15368 RepID=A0A2K2D889_BRADI|nr:hypothetical protein BRADI_2g12815v3 [Brachypodium distachyon]